MAKIFNILNFFGTDKPTSAEERKAQTERALTKLGVPINKHLPYIEDYQTAKFQESQDVARRLVILSIIRDCVHGYDDLTKESTIQYLKDFGLWDYVSEIEKHYLQSSEVDQKIEIQLSWRAESMKVLFWALGFIKNLKLPIEFADLALPHKAVHTKYKSSQEFIEQATLRKGEEILDEMDFIYRAHWAVRDAQLRGRKVPANFNADIVYERHYALNWLTCYADDWDDVSCDT